MPKIAQKSLFLPPRPTVRPTVGHGTDCQVKPRSAHWLLSQPHAMDQAPLLGGRGQKIEAHVGRWWMLVWCSLLCFSQGWIWNTCAPSRTRQSAAEPRAAARRVSAARRRAVSHRVCSLCVCFLAVGPMSQAVEPMYGWSDGVIATM
jgi:hypothetical protein